MRHVAVTIEATGWEVWDCRVPNDVDDEWIRENFAELDDKRLHESGADAYMVTNVEWEDE